MSLQNVACNRRKEKGIKDGGTLFGGYWEINLLEVVWILTFICPPTGADLQMNLSAVHT